MSQEQAIILLFKIGAIAGFASIITWVAVYTRLAKWWRNPIGRTLVAKSLLLAGLLVPTIMSLFFHFNRLTSYVAGWVDVALICAIAPVMAWRTVVWLKVGKERLESPEDKS